MEELDWQKSFGLKIDRKILNDIKEEKKLFYAFADENAK